MTNNLQIYPSSNNEPSYFPHSLNYRFYDLNYFNTKRNSDAQNQYCLDRLSSIIYRLIRLYNLPVSSSKRLARNFDQSIFLIVNDTHPTLPYFALYLFELLLQFLSSVTSIDFHLRFCPRIRHQAGALNIPYFSALRKKTILKTHSTVKTCLPLIQYQTFLRIGISISRP